MSNLDQFERWLEEMATDVEKERLVRLMVGTAVKDCPMEALFRLGRCLAEFRRLELRSN